MKFKLLGNNTNLVYKSLRKIVSFLLLVAFLFSCSKDNSSPTPTVIYPEENFFNDLITKSGLGLTITDGLGVQYVLGINFKPIVNGKINSIVVKVPKEGDYTATIWDNSNGGNIIKTRTFTILPAYKAVENVIIIDPLPVQKGKTYTLTLNMKEFYSHYNTLASGYNVPYPITSGNIVITGFGFKSSPAETQPNPNTLTNLASYIDGDFSFNFQRTE